MAMRSSSSRNDLDRDLSTLGLIRCAITEGLGTFWLMGRLTEFNRSNPHSLVDLKCSMDICDVAHHASDVAVQLVRPTDHDLRSAKLGRLHAYPFASPTYVESYGTPASVADLVNHKIIHQTGVQLGDDTLQRLLGPSVNIEGIVALRTDASTAHYYAVERGLGLGFVPTYGVPLGADIVPLDIGRRNEMDIWLTYRRDMRAVPRIALFIDWLKSQFDPRKYPWFGDDFIHPNELAKWTPRPEEREFFKRTDSMVAHAPKGVRSRHLPRSQ